MRGFSKAARAALRRRLGSGTARSAGGRRRGLAAPVAALLALLSACGGGSPTAQPARPLVYAALGASDAVGVGAFPPSAGYVYLLAERMRAVRGEVTLRNLGISGARVEEIAASALPQAVAARPDVVTVWTGANDLVRGAAPDVFAAELDRLLGELRARSAAEVYVADLPDLTEAPLFRLDPDPDVTAARLAAFNQRIAEAVRARGCVLVRLSAMPVDPTVFSIDGFHPSNAGHARIADLFWTEIRPRL